MALSRAQIQTAFQNSLGRAASTSEENSYFSVSQSGALQDAQIYTTISNSQEANLISDPVVRFYQAAFGRVPDQGGLDNTQDYIRANGASAQTYQNLSDMFAQSPEFTNRFGTGTAVDAAYVQALYSTILGRTASAAEVNAFTSGANGYTTRGGVLYAISQSQEAISVSDAAVNGFLNNAAEGDAVYTGTLYTQGNGQPDAPGVVGQTFTLTTAVDNVIGTAGNDTILGTTAGNTVFTGSTLTSGDAFNGGAGTDTLRVTATSNATIVPTLTSVENIEINSFGTPTLNLVNSAGIQNITLANGSGDANITNLQALVTLGATNTTGGTLDVDYAAQAVAGLSDVQNIAFNNAGLNTEAGRTAISVDGVETFAVTATGANVVNLVGTDVATITVAGAGSVDFGQVGTTVETFNASASTGAITVDVSSTTNVAVTGGSGNDQFIFGTSFTADDTVNGGAGFDTLIVEDAGNLSLAADAAPFNALTSIERVVFTGDDGVTLNGTTFNNAGITNLQFDTGGNDVILNAGSARTYEFATGNAGSAEFALKTGATTLNIDLLGTAGTAAPNNGTDADLAGLTVTTAGANSTTTPVTINLSSNGDLADTFFNAVNTAAGTPVGTAPTDAQINETGRITAASGSTVNVDGDGNLQIIGAVAEQAPGTLNAGFANNVNLNTSALTGNTILAGSDVALTAPGANTSTTTGVDTFTLGAGKDIIVFTSGSASGIAEAATVGGAVGTATGNILVDTINNFTAGTGGDVLYRGTALTQVNAGAQGNYTALLSATQDTINSLSGAGATLSQAANLAANDASTAWTAFSFGNETYALFDAGQGDNTGYASGTDTLVKLTGVSIASLTDANFAVTLI